VVGVGSEGQRPGFIKAQPNGLGIVCAEQCGLKARVICVFEHSNDAGLQPA